MQIGCVFVQLYARRQNDCGARSNGRGLGVLQVEKELGERRAVGYSGVGLGVSAELHYKAMSEEASDPDNVRPLRHIVGGCVLIEDFRFRTMLLTRH